MLKCTKSISRPSITFFHDRPCMLRVFLDTMKTEQLFIEKIRPNRSIGRELFNELLTGGNDLLRQLSSLNQVPIVYPFSPEMGVKQWIFGQNLKSQPKFLKKCFKFFVIQTALFYDIHLVVNPSNDESAGLFEALFLYYPTPQFYWSMSLSARTITV